MIRNEIEIMDHQPKAIQFMLAHNYAICADEQGLGKTLEAIAVQQASDLTCLVICPATLKLNWKDEYEKFTDETSVTVGLKPSKINIVNYENIYKCTELFMKADMIIIDEAHYLIHLDAQRTTYAHRMIRKYLPERLLLLTGTPIRNRVTDFYSLLVLCSYSPIKNNGRLITDKFKTQEAFNKHFANEYQMKVKVTSKTGTFYKTVKKYSGIRNEEELKLFMKHKLIRRLASKVLTLPPLIFKPVQVSYKHDEKLDKAYQAHVKGESFDITAKASSAKNVASFTADYVRDIIKSGEGPVIVFSDHIAPLDVIEKKLNKKFKVAVITGRTKVEVRHAYVKAFQANELDAILCSVGAASTGITLTASRNMVLNDEPWDASHMSQLLKRFHRIGQTRSCVVHKMFGSSVAKKISMNLAEKQSDINKVIQGDKNASIKS